MALLNKPAGQPDKSEQYRQFSSNRFFRPWAFKKKVFET